MKKTFALTTLSFAILAGCNAGSNKSGGLTLAPIDEKDAVAMVNGQPISRQALEYVKADIARGNPNAKIDVPEEKLVEELISHELLKQEAVQQQLPKQPEVAAKVRYAQRAVLSRADVQEYLKNHPVTEEQLRAEYDKLVGAMKQKEFKARHILVKTKEEAESIIKKLEKGKDFAELAKKYSTGPSAASGGDLGWFVPQRMVPAFSEAVVKLKDGEYTKEPVQTRFGWHVILREDSREKTPPPFEQVKPQVENMLKRKLIQEHIKELREKADVKILTATAAAPEAAPAEEKPETSEQPAPDASKEQAPAPAKATPGPSESKAEPAKKPQEKAAQAEPKS